MKTRRGALSALCIAGVLVVAACGSDSDVGSSADTAAPGTTAPLAPPLLAQRRLPDGTSAGTTAAGGDSIAERHHQVRAAVRRAKKSTSSRRFVTARPTRAPRACVTAYKPLEECTGVKVVYDGTDQFETEVIVRVDGGNPPDVIDFPQPGGFLDLDQEGSSLPVPRRVGRSRHG